MTDTTTAAPPRRGLLRRFLDITLGRLLKWLLMLALVLLVLGAIAFALFVYAPTTTIPPLEIVDDNVALDQGWGSAFDSPLRQRYYYTPQGTAMPQGALLAPLRYAWFKHLELPLSTDRFAAPDHMRRYRFIVDPQPTAANPDHFPVGFTRRYESALGEDVLDVTCAACHSGEIHAIKDGRRVAVRIDGGQAMHAFTDMARGSFGPTLIASLAETWINPWKFDRFARRVIGDRYPQGKDALHRALYDNIVAFATLGQNSPLRGLYPAQEGFGRTDALGRIANTVFGDHLSPANYREGEAPVSYPYVWNIWKFDWVQYNGSVAQPLARNIGEALGVGAVLRMTDTYGNPLPPAARYDSSVLIDNLVGIEHALQQLTPPRWPEDLLGRVDREKAARGKPLFEQRCQICHGPHLSTVAQQQAGAPLKPSPDVEWRIEVIPLAHIGTDPATATAFVENTYDLSATGLTPAELSGVLKPLLVRALARDARYRLSAVIDGRIMAGLDTGTLPALLAAYPDPNANPEPSLPLDAFAAIAAELQRLGEDDEVKTVNPPPEAFDCDLECQTDQLSWDVHGAAGYIDRRIGAIDLRRVGEGEGLNILGLLIKRKYFDDRGLDYAAQQCVEGFATLDLPQVVAGYKPRPLEGVWATPPFLHNGSVPTIHELLLPPEQRRTRFMVGRRDYDAERLGFVAEPSGEDRDSGFWLDTTQPGNRNTGHAFVADPEQWQRHVENPSANPLPPGVIGPLLSDDERGAILEYLKIHRDPATPAGFVSPECGTQGSAAVSRHSRGSGNPAASPSNDGDAGASRPALHAAESAS